MIGKHYDKYNYNCANFVAEWYEKNLGIVIPVVNEFSFSFTYWMRKNFTKINEPINHCLVLMINLDGSYHVGIYHDYWVIHNHQPTGVKGAVCKNTLGSIKTSYQKVRFYKWSY